MSFKTLAKNLDIKMTASPAEKNPYPSMDEMPKGSKHWRCRFTYRGHCMTVYYSMGPALRRTPKVGEVLRSVIDEAFIGDTYSYTDFCWGLGYDDDAKTKQIYQSVLKLRNKAYKLFGAETMETLQKELIEV